MICTVLWFQVYVPKLLRREDGIWFRTLMLPMLALGTGIAMWSIGLVLAAIGGFLNVYFTTWPAYLAGFGSFWSVFWYLWAVRNVPGMIKRSTIVLSSPAAAEAFAEKWRRQIISFPCAPVAPILVILATYVIVKSHLDHSLPGLPRLSSSWSSEPRLWIKNLIVIIWSVPIVCGIGGSAVGTLKYSRAVYELALDRRQCPVFPSVPLVREGFRRIALFGVIGGLAWTGAIMVIAASLATQGFRWPPDPKTWEPAVVVGGLSLFGFFLLLWPDWTLHRGLVRLRAERVEEAATLLRSRLEQRITGGASTHSGVSMLEAKLEAARAESTWIRGYEGAVALTGQIVIPAGTFALSVFLHGL